MRRQLWIGLALAVMTAAVYARVGSYSFITFDDHDYVVENPHVNQGISRANVAWALTSFDAANWHPLTWISLQLDVTLFSGPQRQLERAAHGAHVVNVILHILAGLVLFAALARMTNCTWRSALVAGLFLLHPLHVESVAWISERKDVLSALFWMLTIWAYAHYAGERRGRWYGATIAFLVLGILSKPMVVTLPFVLLLLDFWPLRRWGGDGDEVRPMPAISLTRLLLEKLPMLALAAASCVITIIAQRKGEAVWTAVPFPMRISNAILSYVRYIGMMFWPMKLAIVYPHQTTTMTAVPLATTAAALALLLAITAAVVLARRRAGHLLVGWLWYLGTLVPVIGLVQVGVQGYADRYTYLPLVGLFIMVAFGLGDGIATALARRPQRQRGAVFGTIGAAMLLACAALTVFQIGLWKDSITLFTHTIAVTNGNYTAHESLAVAYLEVGRKDEAIEHFQSALHERPDYPEAHANIANFLAERKQWKQAEEHFRAAIAAKPSMPEAHNGLGNMLSETGRNAEALREYQLALQLKPDFPAAHRNMALTYAAEGDFPHAAEHFRAVAALQPNDAKVHYLLAAALQQQQALSQAAREYQIAAELDPNLSEPPQKLAWLLATSADPHLRQPDAAVRYAQRAVALTQERDAWALDTLAAAFACRGDFDKAVAAERRALALISQQNQPGAASSMQKRLKLYQTKRPLIIGAAQK
ncbi:MAG TPA: tetratricopeptide repeat protein [Tepidisphaeraceae bacterium]